MMTQILDQMAASMAAQTGKPAFDQKSRNALAAAVQEVMTYDEIMRWSAELYAERFTTKELEELIRFYKTPLGIKLAVALPSLMGEVGKKMGAIMPERLPAALKKHGLVP